VKLLELPAKISMKINMMFIATKMIFLNTIQSATLEKISQSINFNPLKFILYKFIINNFSGI
jgi:hypothetical protein